MKPKCAHRYSIAGSVTTDLERIFTLRCACGKEKTQKRKMPSRSHTKAPGLTKPRKPIRKASEKRKAVNAEYSKLRAKFLEEKPKCEVEGCKEAATEVHHKSGRYHGKMLDPETWMATCSHHHRQIHDQPAWAKAQGYIQPIFS